MKHIYLLAIAIICSVTLKANTELNLPTLLPTKNATISTYSYNSNLQYTFLSIKYVSFPEDHGEPSIRYQQDILIDFAEIDVTNLISAKLNLYCKSMRGTSSFEILSNLNSWEENTITWGNAPNIGSTYQTITPTSIGYHEVDVLNLITENNSNPSFRFRMVDRTGDKKENSVSISSRTDSPDIQPKLILEYSTTPTYNISFNANGATEGNMSSIADVELGQIVLPDAMFTKDQHLFIGWATSPNGEVVYEDGQSISLTSNKDLYAVWQQVYTIDFDANGGLGTMNGMQDLFGSNTLIANSFTREGYNFKGWATSPSGTNEFTDEATLDITASMVLYATWELITYSVRFEDYDGTLLSEQTIDFSAAATAPTEPTRDGYRFTGWDITFDNITADITVTAEYIAFYSVRFEDFDATLLSEQTVDFSAAATAPIEPTRDGYRFTGWDATFDNITADITITAEYIAVYSVRFEDSDGSTLSEETIDEGAAATAPTEPTRDGYRFTGWDLAIDNITADITVTAQYIAIYTVRFEDYDGTTLSEETIDEGAAATAPTEPTRDGYTFTEWDVAFDNITSDLVVTAVYEIYSGISTEGAYLFNVFPNPATTQFTVEGANGETVKMYNTTGAIVLQLENISNKQSINISELPKGFYLVKVANEAHRLLIK